MLARLSKILVFSHLFAHIIVAAPQKLPKRFESVYSEPSKGRMYGCIGNHDRYSLSLDLVNKTYTKMHLVCDRGDMLAWGLRGNLIIRDDKILKIITEWGSIDENEEGAPIKWIPIYADADGYFTFDEATHTFDEFEDNGDFITRWEEVSWL